MTTYAAQFWRRPYIGWTVGPGAETYLVHEWRGLDLDTARWQMQYRLRDEIGCVVSEDGEYLEVYEPGQPVRVATPPRRLSTCYG